MAASKKTKATAPDANNGQKSPSAEAPAKYEVPIGRQEIQLTVEQAQILEEFMKNPKKSKAVGREMPTTTIEEIRRKRQQ